LWYTLLLMEIGQRLRELRESKKFSQGDIEKRTGPLLCNTPRVECGHTTNEGGKSQTKRTKRSDKFMGSNYRKPELVDRHLSLSKQANSDE
jgi:hypothetical protein